MLLFLFFPNCISRENSQTATQYHQSQILVCKFYLKWNINSAATLAQNINTCIFKLAWRYSSVSAVIATLSCFSCVRLCNPIDGSPPGSSVPGIPQARILEWVAISFFNHESERGKWSLSVVSDSSRPHGLQPTRFLCPWDFPGESTGVGCHCLLPQT